MEEKPKPNENQTSTDSVDSSADLETNSTQVESDSNSIDATDGSNADTLSPDAATKKLSLLQRIKSGINIYLLLMIIVIFVAAIIIVLTYMTSKKVSGTPTDLSSQALTQNALEQLANSDTNSTVGTSNQVLTVQSSSIFTGKVLMRQDLEVAGNLDVGNTLTLNDIAVTGTAQIGQLNVSKDLSISGNSNVQGSSTIGKSLQVNGNGIFSGPITAPQVTTTSLQINGDLVITHHIVTGGSTPKLSFGSALGNGGTASLSGDDTSGSININTGGSPFSGCFVSVNFASTYNTTPHVVITPIGYNAGGLNYYITRTSTGFSVCDASNPPGDVNFGFDYMVLD